ncbi:MAG: hypothetical protein R3A51_06640 [Nannocystaceae bacterium]|nr:hypothetical protein [Myxococcales bacterium]
MREEPQRPQSQATPRVRRRDVVVGALVLLAWLTPLAQGAVLGRPKGPWPFFWKDLCTVSCLFPTAPREIQYYHLEVARQGRPVFYPLEEAEYFQLQPFGYRTRFDYFMARWGAHSPAPRQDLVEWIARRDRELHPAEPPIVRVRFLRSIRPIRADTPPTGRWRKPPRPDRARDRVGVLAVHEVRGSTP